MVQGPYQASRKPNQFNHIKTRNPNLLMERIAPEEGLGEVISTVRDLIGRTNEKIKQSSFNQA